jgi:predicted RNase H-like HicB family nuclease
MLNKSLSELSRTEVRSLKFTATIEIAEEGGFVIRCIELPVATEGESREEAIANLRMIEGCIDFRAEVSEF